MATKPVPPRGPTDEELLAVGEVTPENAPVDTLPESEEERRMVEEAKRDPRWVPGDVVSEMIAARRRAAE